MEKGGIGSIHLRLVVSRSKLTPQSHLEHRRVETQLVISYLNSVSQRFSNEH